MSISPAMREDSGKRPTGRARRSSRLFFDRLEARRVLATTPAFSINDVTLIEGDAGTFAAAQFTVSLSKPSHRPVSVDYATSDGTAVEGPDYLETRGTLDFKKGQTSKSVIVLLRGDTLDEANETFFVTLSHPSKATISDGTGQATIVDDDPPPVIALGDVAIAEGDSGTASATFDVTLSAPSGQAVTVAYGTDDGTATAGSDYTPTSGTLTFAPGQTSQTVAVPVVGDVLDEADETFVVNLSAPVNADIADVQGLGTIVDDDPSPSLLIDSQSITEGDEGSQGLTFTVSLSAPSGQTVTVAYETLADSATADTDFTTTSGTLTFLPGTIAQTIIVPVVGDLFDEPDESFFVQLSGAVNAAIVAGGDRGTGTILDDDPAPSFSISDATVTEGPAGSTNASFTVTLSAPSNQVVTVAFDTADDSATAGSDYTSTGGTLTFLPGQTSQTVSVPVLGDTSDEANESFFVRLSNPVNATIADNQGVGTILDDDPTPTLSISDASVTEGDSGSVDASFTVTLAGKTNQVVTVAFATANGSATAGADYTARGGTLTFQPGQTSQTITVPVLGDTLDEANEIFVVRLSNSVNATIADLQGNGTILDNDPSPSLSISDATVIEGDAGARSAVFTVSLSFATSQITGFSFTTANGSATGGLDYTPTSGNRTFLAGQTSQTISVPILDDTLIEPDETFFVRLSNAGSLTIADGEGVGTILDNDTSVSISDTSALEGDPSTPGATFTVTLAVPSRLTVTVSYTTANGTAVAGSDYTATSGSLTFLPGQTSQTVSIPILNDALDEPNQTFSVRLTSAVNATIADPQGVGTIVDDDPPPTLSISDATVIEGDSGQVNALFTVTLSAPSERTVTAAIATANGSATVGSDYNAIGGTLAFAPGQTSKTVLVPVLGDTIDEPDETFFVRLNNPGNATITDGEGLGTIVDNDPTPTFTIQDASIVEGNSGSSFLVFHVLLSGPSSGTEWVVFTTSDGTASASDGDYTPQTTETGITFLAGVTDQTIAIPILGDTSIEPDEEFFVNLIGASQAIDDNQAVGTIINDD